MKFVVKSVLYAFSLLTLPRVLGVGGWGVPLLRVEGLNRESARVLPEVPRRVDGQAGPKQGSKVSETSLKNNCSINIRGNGQ